jgi:phthalate 4,5-dioxygenase oxygenase subunit
MLVDEDNELLARTGPGTLMGELMRQYWLPVLLASELPAPDCDPVRVMVLGEALVAFRDSSGSIGLLEHFCPHRGASLFFGRNEQGGLRCVYHGWKFDVSGRCLDMPNEPPSSRFKEHVRATAYPCVERGGVIWSYLGPRETPPPFPELEVADLAEGEREVFAVHRECNWLQAIEGELDTSHLGFLHMGAQQPDDFEPGSFAYYTVKDRAPRYAALDTDYGAMYGAYRPTDEGQVYWRIAQFLFPVFSHIPTGVLGEQVLTRAWVPMDDHHVMFFSMGKKGGQVPVVADAELQPNGTGWFERFRPLAEFANDYRMDRALQRSKSFTGIPGIHMQDKAITESMGPILRRSGEHLASSDVMVTRLRRRLLEVARALADKGTVPPGVEDPDVYRVRAGGVILPEGADWVGATAELVKP